MARSILGSLLQGNAPDDDALEDDGKPSEHLTRELVDCFHERWTDDGVNINNVMEFICNRLQVPMDDFCWDAFNSAKEREILVCEQIYQWVKHHDDLANGDTMQKFTQATTVVLNIHDAVKGNARTVCNMNPESVSVRRMLPEALRSPDILSMYNDHMLRHDQKTNSNFQNAFMCMREQLESLDFLRAGDSFFKKVKLQICGGEIDSLAYEAATTISEFVQQYGSYSTSMSVWRWLTNPLNNQKGIIEYLTENKLVEAPDLEVDSHFRSYAGDAFGIGSGVYDSLNDIFYPYISPTSEWIEFAQGHARARQAIMGKNFDYAPPQSSTVCVVHLHCAFPYSTYDEVQGTPGQRDVQSLLRALPEAWKWPLVKSAPVGAQWREAYEFECATHLSVKLPQSEALAAHLASRIPADPCSPDPPHFEEHPYGISWMVQPLNDETASALKLIVNEDLLALILEDEKCVHPIHRVWGPKGSECMEVGNCVPPFGETGTFAMHLGDDRYAIFTRQPPRRPRILLTPQEWRDMVSHQTTLYKKDLRDVFVQHGNRFFMPDIGRTAFDCDALEIDQIFDCQSFEPHDKHHCYAYMGRLLFEVGELDHHEGTLFFQGIGGCGKSTILNAIKPFWPRHLIATLSSNMQSQFGMASLAHGKVVMCSEVSEELNLPQEEWQDATGGGTLSLARKFKDPLVMDWLAQFVWAGNQFPKRWKNQQMQVSRRLAGVLMNNPVRGRDGTIAQRISKKLGSLQRKIILAYFTLLHAYGNTDPMSQEDRLPPAFRSFLKTGREATNPMLAFINEGSYVKKEMGASMLLEDLRQLFNEWRINNDMGKTVRWSEDVYKSAFSELDLVIEKSATYGEGEESLTNVTIVHHLRNMREGF